MTYCSFFGKGSARVQSDGTSIAWRHDTILAIVSCCVMPRPRVPGDFTGRTLASRTRQMRSCNVLQGLVTRVSSWLRRRISRLNAVVRSAPKGNPMREDSSSEQRTTSSQLADYGEPSRVVSAGSLIRAMAFVIILTFALIVIAGLALILS
jgi:hypothetical protein